MNIKINIKDCDCSPAVITRKQISEVQFKKKNMLYAPPTKNRKQVTQQTAKKTFHNNSQNNSRNNQIQIENNVNFQEAEKKLVEDLSQISKNQVTMDMVHNSNSILQRQNQILQSNQRTLHNMVSNSRNTAKQPESDLRNRQLRRIFQQSADKIARQVKQIKKMRDQIVEAGQSFKRVLSQGKNSNISNVRGPAQIGEMSSNLKNMVELSKNHIEGLQNLEGIKSLQNFNIEAYTQAINTLKKQIVQYQKQSQNIQRQLKLRSAKLQKLQISPNFEQQLLQPYEQYLKKKADSVDLHAIKQKIYQKLGVFDYGKFQFDMCTVTNEVKNQMNDFYIICKQYRIDIPDIKIDKRQLQQLDLNLPSVLDQFKASKGITFNQQRTEDQKLDNKKTGSLKGASKEFLNQPKKSTKTNFNQRPNQQLGVLYTKPVDYSKDVKLERLNKNQYKSVLQTKQQKQKKQVFRNIQKKNNSDDDFQKYLQNRAKQQLAVIYQQKRKKLQEMQKKLYQTAKQQPKYELSLNIKNKISQKQKKSPQSYANKRQQDQYNKNSFEQQEKHSDRKQQRKEVSRERDEIKSVGTQVLREKLKNLFSKNPNLNEHVHQNRLVNQKEYAPQSNQNQMNQMNSLAQGFINMINNTLTQVNSQLSQSIQKKMQNQSISKQKVAQFERKSPNRITIPKLQQFRAPPVFNMQMIQQPAFRTEQKKHQKKIIAKDYNHYRVKEQNDDLEISGMSLDD